MSIQTNTISDLKTVPDLDAVSDHFRMIREQAVALVSGLTDVQFNWRPAPDRWSMAQCLDHLNVAGYLLLPRLEAAVNRARATGRRRGGRVAYGLVGQYFIRSVSPVPTRKLKAPAAYVPTSTWAAMEEVVPRFTSLQDRLEACADDGVSYDLSRVKVVSPVTNLLRLNAAVWLVATAAHEQRHLLQAHGVLEDDAFPRGA